MYTIEVEGEKFEGNYRQALNFIISHYYRTHTEYAAEKENNLDA